MLLPQSSTEKQIKKHYRKLSLKLCVPGDCKLSQSSVLLYALFAATRTRSHTPMTPPRRKPTRISSS